MYTPGSCGFSLDLLQSLVCSLSAMLIAIAERTKELIEKKKRDKMQRKLTKKKFLKMVIKMKVVSMRLGEPMITMLDLSEERY